MRIPRVWINDRFRRPGYANVVVSGGLVSNFRDICMGCLSFHVILSGQLPFGCIDMKLERGNRSRPALTDASEERERKRETERLPDLLEEATDG